MCKQSRREQGVMQNGCRYGERRDGDNKCGEVHASMALRCQHKEQRRCAGVQVQRSAKWMSARGSAMDGCRSLAMPCSRPAPPTKQHAPLRAACLVAVCAAMRPRGTAYTTYAHTCSSTHARTQARTHSARTWAAQSWWLAPPPPLPQPCRPRPGPAHHLRRPACKHTHTHVCIHL